MKQIRTEHGFALFYTISIIVIITFVILCLINYFFHLQFMSKNEHNVARLDYFVLVSCGKIEQLIQVDETIDGGLFEVNDIPISFKKYNEKETEVLWHLFINFEEIQHFILIYMDKESKRVTSWLQKV